MYRQFDGLSDQLASIVTWEYHNRDQFPVADGLVHFVPTQFADSLHGLPRTLHSIVSPRIGGERFGPKFDRWFVNHLKSVGSDAVLAQFGHYAMVAEAACRKHSIPVFAHFHGHDLSARLRKKRYRKALEENWHSFAGMIVVATYQRDVLLDCGVPDERVALIPCGAPTHEITRQIAEFKAKSAQNPPSEQDTSTRFLFVGRFVEKKDPFSVLKAFAKCHADNPKVTLRMAGDGPLLDACKSWVAEQPESAQNAITFLGSLSPVQVLQELSGADALVQHSRVAPDGDMEGWPVSIAEAMAAGLPIVATRHAGIVDQVAEGINGLLCDEGDWLQMSQDLGRVASNDPLRAQMGIRSLERAREFDSGGQVQQLREFINNNVTVRDRQAA